MYRFRRQHEKNQTERTAEEKSRGEEAKEEEEVMETILLIATVGLLCVACFFLGARTAQKAVRGEEIAVPTFGNLHDSYKEKQQERREKEEAMREAEKLEAILQNMERYDGTPAGQQDI